MRTPLLLVLEKELGNASFEQVLMSFRLLGKRCSNKFKNALKSLIKKVSSASNRRIDANLPIIGKIYFPMNLEFM